MRKLGGVAIFGLFAAVAVMILLPRDLQNVDWVHLKSTSAVAPVKIVAADFKVVAPAAALPDVTTLAASPAPFAKALVWYKAPATIVPAAVMPVAAVPPATDFRFTTASGLNMRTEPSVDAALVISLQKGTRIAVIQTSGHWLEVTTDDGQSGWLSSNFVSAPTTIPAVAAAPKAQDNQLVSSVAK